MIFSFDIFDTILCRNTLTPKGIFAFMRQAIKRDPKYPITLRLNFFHIRVRAETEARKRLTAIEEVTLEEIYRIIQSEYGLTDLAMRELMALELKLEIENTYGIDEMVFRVKQMLSSGEKVILISDMYLPLNTVRKMLQCVAPDLSDLPIYLSSQIGLRKSTGSLYRHILAQEAIRPSELRHVGDSHEFDFCVPTQLGITAECFKESWLTEAEMTIICRYAREYDVTRQLVGGIVRKMRLHLLRGNRFTPMVFSFGPVLYGFIHETLKRILASGKQRVYFIARDGRPLKLVADAIIAARGYPLETRYIYGSRQAWRQAAIFDPRYDLYWIGENFSDSDFSLRQVLERVDHDAEKLFSLLPDKLRSRVSLDRSPSHDEIGQVQEAMVTHPPLNEYVMNVAQIKRTNALKYFEKSGLLDSVPYALIDIGWSGKMQHCLYSLLQSKSPDAHLEEYYFAIDDSGAGFESDFDNKKHLYFIDMYLSGFYFFSLYMEMFVQGDHGRCIGYDDNGEAILSGDGQYLRNWGVHEYYECLQTFVGEYATVSRNIPYQEEFRHMARDLTKYLLRPTEQMAALFGSLLFSEDQNDALIGEYAPALSRAEARAAAFGILKLRWKEASLVRSSPHVRKLFRRYEFLQDVRKLFRRYEFLQDKKNAIKTILKGICNLLGITNHVKRLLKKAV